MTKSLILLVALLFVSCATSTKQTDRLVKKHDSLPEKSLLQGVPLIQQARNHCGPATMTMVLRYEGIDASLDEVTSQLFTEKMEGSFQTDMLSTARRHGMITISITNMTALIKEVSEGHPVIVFQNLGLTWSPRWHYAVVTGHDFNGPDIFLHTGNEKNVKTDMRFFERTWKLGNYWGLLVLKPNQLSETGSEKDHLEAANLLESSGKIDEAFIAYKTILKKWPNNLVALIGLGNVTYSKKQFTKSAEYLETATKLHPDSALAWHNLATAQGAAGQKAKAKKSAKKALELADEATRESFEGSLNSWL